MKNPKYLLPLVVLLFSLNAMAQPLPLPSSVYEYKMIPGLKTAIGEERHLFSWPTKTLDNFEIDIFTLQAGKQFENSSIDTNTEKLIVIYKGSLGITFPSESMVLGERSTAVIANGEQVSFENQGPTETTFFVIQWVTGDRGIPYPPASFKGFKAFDYQKMEFTETAKGGRRGIMEAPTSTLHELEMHITTLLEGEKSHDPHVHPDEEIILILQGEVEEMINGTPYRLGPGSVIFLGSMDPHGIRNIGKGSCEYYAIRWTSTKD